MTAPAASPSAAFAPGTTTGRDHPQTSVEAAYRALGRSGTCRRRILFALSLSPMTDEEMQFHLRMGANTQRPRRIELVRLGMVTASENQRRSISGSWSIVWAITPLGRRALAIEAPE